MKGFIDFILTKELYEEVSTSELRGRPAFDAAKEHMAKRYPRLTKHIQSINYSADNSWGDHVTNFVHGSYNPNLRRLEVNSVPNKFKPSDYVHVLSHEYAHVGQTRKPNKVFDFQKSYDKYPYEKNPYEIKARKTGDSIRDNYKKKFEQG